METGIYAKMEDDVGRNKNWTTAWTKPTNRKKEPLEMSHVEPLFIMFGAAIMASIVAFGLEFLSIRMKETFAAATLRMMHRHIQHGAGASKIWIRNRNLELIRAKTWLAGWIHSRL